MTATTIIEDTSETFVSRWSGKTYIRYIYNGKAVGCTCGFRQNHTFTPCKHMTEYNSERDAQAYASRLHNDVSYEKYSADVERENSTESLERRIAERDAERDAERTAYNNYCLSMGI